MEKVKPYDIARISRMMISVLFYMDYYPCQS